MIFNYNLFKIELININIKIMMIKNIIVLNIYNLKKIFNLQMYVKNYWKLNKQIMFNRYCKYLIGKCIKMIENKIVY